MTRRWIVGATSRSQWHLAKREDREGQARYVTACRGFQIGGAYGARWRVCTRPDEIEHLVCAACDKIAGTTPASYTELEQALRAILRERDTITCGPRLVAALDDAAEILRRIP